MTLQQKRLLSSDERGDDETARAEMYDACDECHEQSISSQSPRGHDGSELGPPRRRQD